MLHNYLHFRLGGKKSLKVIYRIYPAIYSNTTPIDYRDILCRNLAISEYHARTCIKFVEKMETDKDWIHILPDDGKLHLESESIGRIFL